MTNTRKQTVSREKSLSRRNKAKKLKEQNLIPGVQNKQNLKKTEIVVDSPKQRIKQPNCNMIKGQQTKCYKELYALPIEEKKNIVEKNKETIKSNRTRDESNSGNSGGSNSGNNGGSNNGNSGGSNGGSVNINYKE